MDFQTTNITYKGLTDTGGPTVTILDENKRKWTIWKKDYKNKTQDSEAYGSLKNYEIGDTFGISYGEQPEQFVNSEGKTINFTKRTIYAILPTVANPTTVPSKTESPRSASGASDRPAGGNSRPEVDWDQLGLIKAYHNLIAADFSNGKDLKYVQDRIDNGTYWLLCKAVETDVKNRMAKGWAKAEAIFKEDIPVIQVEDLAEDIPF
jgi:hypothetical protein